MCDTDMKIDSRLARQSPKLSCRLLGMFLPLVFAAAQTDPAVQGIQTPGDQAGFSLKTAGGIEPYNWGTANPIMRFNFSIERSDRTLFNGLAPGNVRAAIDEPEPIVGQDGRVTQPPGGVAIPIHPGDLQITSAGSVSVMLVIDGSGSMVTQRSGQSIDKLSAAKAAIYDFLDGLHADDKVAIIAFDDAPRFIFALNASKSAAKTAVANFAIRQPGAKYTALYDSMKFAVEKARDLGVHHIVFLTDGMEDTLRFNRLDPSHKDAYRLEREREIASLAHTGDVHIYTIGIGDRNAKPSDMAFVDFDTLSRISKQTAQLDANYVNLPKLARENQNNPAGFHASLVAQLKSILTEISKAFHFDYTLVLRPIRSTLPQDGTSHMVTVVCSLEKVQLPVRFSFVWSRGSDTPEISAPHVGKPIFYKLDQKANPVTLITVCLIFFSILILMALIPPLLLWMAKRKQVSVANQAVITVGDRSPHIGKECPNELSHLGRDYLIKKGDVIVVCPNPECETAHHVGCWHLGDDMCWVRTCKRYVPIDPMLLDAQGVED